MIGVKEAAARLDIVVFSSLHLAEAHLVRGLLTCEGVNNRIRNELLPQLGGEVPFNDVRVEVLVAKADEAQALALIKGAGEGAEWVCPSCHEKNPAAFELCWSCGVGLA